MRRVRLPSIKNDRLHRHRPDRLDSADTGLTGWTFADTGITTHSLGFLAFVDDDDRDNSPIDIVAAETCLHLMHDLFHFDHQRSTPISQSPEQPFTGPSQVNENVREATRQGSPEARQRAITSREAAGTGSVFSSSSANHYNERVFVSRFAGFSHVSDHFLDAVRQLPLPLRSCLIAFRFCFWRRSITASDNSSCELSLAGYAQRLACHWSAQRFFSFFAAFR